MAGLEVIKTPSRHKLTLTGLSSSFANAQPLISCGLILPTTPCMLLLFLIGLKIYLLIDVTYYTNPLLEFI